MLGLLENITSISLLEIGMLWNLRQGADRLDGQREIALLCAEEAMQRKVSSSSFSKIALLLQFTLPAHHDTKALDALQVNWLRILLGPSAICRVEAGPGNEDGFVMSITGLRLRWQLEIAFVRNGCLLSPSVRVGWEQLVLEIECVPLL